MHYFWVLKKFASEWGSINIFCRNFFVSQCRKFLYGNPLPLHYFLVAKKFGYEWGEEYQDFPSKMLCLTVPKISVGESFTAALFPGCEKVWIGWGGGVSRFSVQKFMSHSAEIFHRGVLYCFFNFGY